RAGDDDDWEVVALAQRLADGAHRLKDVAGAERAAGLTGRRDDDEDYFRLARRRPQVGTGAEPSVRLVERLLETRLEHRGLSLVNEAHVALHKIDADDPVTLGGEAGGHRRTEFSQTDNGKDHREPPYGRSGSSSPGDVADPRFRQHFVDQAPIFPGEPGRVVL